MSAKRGYDLYALTLFLSTEIVLPTKQILLTLGACTRGLRYLVCHSFNFVIESFAASRYILG